MPKNKLNPHLEAKVLHKYAGEIDLKKLWKEEEDKEADPAQIETLINAAPIRQAFFIIEMIIQLQEGRKAKPPRVTSAPSAPNIMVTGRAFSEPTNGLSPLSD